MNSFFLYVLSKLTSSTLSLAAIASFSRLLPASEYGAYSLSINKIGIIVVLFLQWPSLALQKFYYSETTQKRKHDVELIDKILFLQGISSLLVLFLASVYSIVSNELLALIVGAAAVLQGYHDLALRHFNVSHNTVRYWTTNAIRSVGLLAFGVSALLFKKSSTLLLTALMLSLAISLPYWKDLRILKSFISPPKKNTIKGYLKYAMPLIASSVLLIVIDTSGRFFIDHYMDQSATGVYAVNYDLVQFCIGSAISIISLYSMPYFFLYKIESNANSLTRLTSKIDTLFVFLILPTFGLLAIFLNDIVSLTSGPEYILKSTFLPVILSLALTVSGLKTCYIDPILQSNNKSNLLFLTTALAAAANILLNFILIPEFGHMGAAISSLSAFSIAAFAGIFCSKKHIKKLIMHKRLIEVLSAGVVIFVIFIVKNKSNIQWQFSLASYLAIWFLFIIKRKSQIITALNVNHRTSQ